MARFAHKLRAVLSLMCLELPSTDDASETEDHELQVRKRTRKQPAETPHYPENTLMGLPTELRALIYKFALQDVVDTIVREAPALSYHSTLDDFVDRSTDRRLSSIPPCRNSLRPAPRLGGLALPCTSRVLRKESLDVYGPLVKAHHERLWERYIGLQNMNSNFRCLSKIVCWTLRSMLIFTGVR